MPRWFLYSLLETQALFFLEKKPWNQYGLLTHKLVYNDYDPITVIRGRKVEKVQDLGGLPSEKLDHHWQKSHSNQVITILSLLLMEEIRLTSWLGSLSLYLQGFSTIQGVLPSSIWPPSPCNPINLPHLHGFGKTLTTNGRRSHYLAIKAAHLIG